MSFKNLNWKNATRVMIRRGKAYRDNSKLYEIEFRWDNVKARSGEGIFSKFIWNNANRELPMPQRNQVVYIDTKDVVKVCNKLGLKYKEPFLADTHADFEVVKWNKSLKDNEVEQKRLLGTITVNDLLTEKKPDVITVNKVAKKSDDVPTTIDWSKVTNMLFGDKFIEDKCAYNEDKKQEVINTVTVEEEPKEEVIKVTKVSSSNTTETTKENTVEKTVVEEENPWSKFVGLLNSNTNEETTDENIEEETEEETEVVKEDDVEEETVEDDNEVVVEDIWAKYIGAFVNTDDISDDDDNHDDDNHDDDLHKKDEVEEKNVWGSFIGMI